MIVIFLFQHLWQEERSGWTEVTVHEYLYVSGRKMSPSVTKIHMISMVPACRWWYMIFFFCLVQPSPFQFLPHRDDALICFLESMIKYPDASRVSKEGIVWVHNFKLESMIEIMISGACELSHTTSTVTHICVQCILFALGTCVI